MILKLLTNYAHFKANQKSTHTVEKLKTQVLWGIWSFYTKIYRDTKSKLKTIILSIYDPPLPLHPTTVHWSRSIIDGTLISWTKYFCGTSLWQLCEIHQLVFRYNLDSRPTEVFFENRCSTMNQSWLTIVLHQIFFAKCAYWLTYIS